MTLESIIFIFGWAALLNYLLLVLWFGIYLFAGDKIFALHSRWFNLDRRQFSCLHYAGMMVYKIAIFLLLLTPYIALQFVPS